LRQIAGKEGILFRTGPFVVRLQTDIDDLLRVFQRLYRDIKPVPGGIVDFHTGVVRTGFLRRLWHPQALFSLDGDNPFAPFPLDHAFPLFEWGLNYSIATRAHQFCLLHSAVLERNGNALVLPAMPGSGKSTLCTALMYRGWRLFSDEFGILQPDTGQLLPMPRVIPLKNRSIQVIRDFAPEAVMGPLFPKTRKGDVVHVAPTLESVERQKEAAKPAWIVFPRFLPGSKTRLEVIPGSQAFVRLSNNSFNYHLLGEISYRALTAMVKGCDCYSFEYSDLDEAVQLMGELAG
jgi:HprK-related kinase A